MDEAPIKFSPTYKYVIGSNEYDKNKKRIPSWTDRILFKKFSETSPLAYNKCLLSLSDHQPIYGVYRIKTEEINKDKRQKIVNQIIKEKFLPLKNVGEVRSIGLINAIELVKNKETKEPLDYTKRTGYQIYKKALEKGVILRPLGDVIYFNPPLIIEKDDMDFVTDVALECMQEVLGQK